MNVYNVMYECNKFMYQGLISLSLEQANGHDLHVLNHRSRLVGKKRQTNSFDSNMEQN